MHCVILGTSNTPPITLTKIIQSIMFTNYPHEGIAFLLGFGMVMEYPSNFFLICYGAKGIIIYPNRGIACALSNYGYK